MKPEDITNARFDTEVRRLAHELGVEYLLSIPGVWELVSEDLNNIAIQRIQRGLVY